MTGPAADLIDLAQSAFKSLQHSAQSDLNSPSTHSRQPIIGPESTEVVYKRGRPWSEDEDKKLISLISTKKLEEISGEMQGRTKSACRCRWAVLEAMRPELASTSKKRKKPPQSSYPRKRRQPDSEEIIQEGILAPYQNTFAVDTNLVMPDPTFRTTAHPQVAVASPGQVPEWARGTTCEWTPDRASVWGHLMKRMESAETPEEEQNRSLE